MEFKLVGGIFWVTILFMILNFCLVLIRFDSTSEINLIRNQWGTLTLPWICLWIIPMFQDLADARGKEALLSLPYNHFTFGAMRVIRTTILYFIIFYIGWCSVSLFLNLFDQWEWFDFVLPLVSIFFLATLSFISIVLTRNLMYSYIIIGVFCSMQYMTRGSALGPLYPFHWSFPNPARTHEENLFILLCVSIIFITISNIFFKNRAFMLKK